VRRTKKNQIPIDQSASAAPDPEYRSRYPKRAYRKLICKLLSELEQLREATDPTQGATTAAGKDAKAFQALRSAAVLTKVLAGWALDHQIGLALAHCEHPPPLVDAKMAKSPEYTQLRTAVDSHEHEKNGSAASLRQEPFETVAARQALINLLMPLSGYILPVSLFIQVKEALQALNYGELLPILQPVKAGKKRKFIELNLQLAALAYVEFRWRSGQATKEEAEEIVANAFGVGSETLHTWERRNVPEGLGRLKMYRTLAHAAAHAAAFKQVEKEDQAGKFFAEQIYGRAALDRDGKEYRPYRKKSARRSNKRSVGGSKKRIV
jgi:hypothetical protein